MIAKQTIHCADLSDIKRHLQTEISDECLEELYRFGGVMLTELNQRMGQIDHKLYSVMGWSSASLAFLLLGWRPTNAGLFLKTTVLIAVALSIISVLLCSLGIKSTTDRVPSEIDWFRSEFYLDASGMARSHLYLLVDLHQRQNLVAASKAEFLARAELFFIPAVVLIGIAVVTRWLLA